MPVAFGAGPTVAAAEGAVRTMPNGAAMGRDESALMCSTGTHVRTPPYSTRSGAAWRVMETQQQEDAESQHKGQGIVLQLQICFSHGERGHDVLHAAAHRLGKI